MLFRLLWLVENLVGLDALKNGDNFGVFWGKRGLGEFFFGSFF